MANQKAIVGHPLQHEVEDIFSYLDLVKSKFNDQSQVFNDLFDILKQFKSRSINILGVIQKVSNLFKDHPELIVGFNQFLPLGYKIEIHSNDPVNISMPNSKNVVLMTSFPIAQPTAVATSAIVTGPSVQQQQQQPQPIVGNLPQNFFVFSASETANLNILQAHQEHPTMLMPRNSIKALLVSLTNNAALSQHSGPNMTQPQLGLMPIQLNNAVNFLNKVKNRFQTQPEVYKQFVGILQSYGKQQQIKENKQVAAKPFRKILMFADVAELLQHQKFSQFLSDATASSSSTAPSHPN